jgi:hypothetical protein
MTSLQLIVVPSIPVISNKNACYSVEFIALVNP